MFSLENDKIYKDDIINICPNCGSRNDPDICEYIMLSSILKDKPISIRVTVCRSCNFWVYCK